MSQRLIVLALGSCLLLGTSAVAQEGPPGGSSPGRAGVGAGPAGAAGAAGAGTPAAMGAADPAVEAADPAEAFTRSGSQLDAAAGPGAGSHELGSPMGPESSGGDAPTLAQAEPKAKRIVFSDVPGKDPHELVSGAPLFNPNVSVHIVEKKAFADSGKHEVTLYPLAVQANGKFTQHLGMAAGYVYHLHENFAFQLTPIFNWYNNESEFNAELIEKVREEAQAATSLLLTWGAHAGVEVTPFYGKFAFYDSVIGHFAIVLNGGAGIGATRHQLKPATPANSTTTASGPTFGDTGTRFLGSVGGGLRAQIGNQFAFRLEVRDLIYTARVDRVNGCGLEDLSAIQAAANAAQPVTSAPVSSGCRASSFEGVDPNTQRRRSDDVPLAIRLVEDLSSDVLNNVGLYLGFSWMF